MTKGNSHGGGGLDGKKSETADEKQRGPRWAQNAKEEKHKKVGKEEAQGNPGELEVPPALG